MDFGQLGQTFTLPEPERVMQSRRLDLEENHSGNTVEFQKKNCE